MRCKRIFLSALLLMFLAVQVVPLRATDKLDSGIEITNPDPNYGDGDGNGGGEEHPWQDDDDDNGGGTCRISKAIDYLIGLFFDKQKEVREIQKEVKVSKEIKKQKAKKFWSPRKTGK